MTRRDLLIGALLAAAAGLLAWVGYQQHAAQQPAAPSATPARAAFHCDGRLRCSEMRSCAEAKFFLKNCPGTQSYMDVDQDRLPCEQELCPQE